jgi:hypothetical protein
MEASVAGGRIVLRLAWRRRATGLPPSGRRLRHRHADQRPARTAPLSRRAEGDPGVGRAARPPQPRDACLAAQSAVLAGGAAAWLCAGAEPGWCDTKSLPSEWSWSERGKEEGPRPRPVPRSVSAPACVAGNGGVRSPESKPKGRPSHRAEPGEEKAGRVSASELSKRPRYERTAEMMDDTADWVADWVTGHRTDRPMPTARGLVRPAIGHQRPRGIESTRPSRSSRMRNVATPMGSGLGPEGQPQGRLMPQRAQEGPRSEGQRPKGNGNP